MSQIFLLTEVSHPEVGSSKYTNLEPPIKAIAIDTLLFYPPDKLLVGACSLNFKSTSSSNYSISSLIFKGSVIPLNLANISK